ncbi:hypothetical protein [Catellatospora sp. NPDC049609]|uniref:hypothetical protein n=1 Tax=Catellatospora sp. NPDC049609 TaxID=3155505 RepID=UPI00343C37BA
MIPVSPELAAAIEAPERQPIVRLSIDWDDNGHGPAGSLDDLSARVESITITRELAGDLPDEVSTLEGSAASTLDVAFGAGDTGTPASAYFSRFNTASALAGKERLGRPVTADIGFVTANGPQYVRRFTGRTDAWTSASASRSVRMRALDLKERLSWDVELPVIARGTAGLNASWITREALARGPLTPFVPSPFPEALDLFVPMAGTMLPAGLDVVPNYTARMIRSRYGFPQTTTGTSFSDITAEPTFVPGPYLGGTYAGQAPGAQAGNAIRGEITYANTFQGDYMVGRVEFWLKRRANLTGESASAWKAAAILPHSSGGAGVLTGVRPDWSTGFGFYTTSPDSPAWVQAGPTVPADGQWHYIGVEWDAATTPGTVAMTFRLDHAAPVTATHSWTPAFLDVQNRSFLFRTPVAEVALSTRTDFNAPPWLIDLADTVNCRLDLSTLELDAVPDPGPRPAWEWIRQLAAAEQAVTFIDEQGVFWYRTAARMASGEAQTIARTVTTTSTLTDLSTDEQLTAVRNNIKVTAQPVTISGALSVVQAVTDVIELKPNQSTWLYWELPGVADVPTAVAINRPSDPAPNTAGSFVCVAFNPAGTTTGAADENLLSTFTAEALRYGGATYQVRVRNNSTKTAYLATAKANTPTVSVVGRKITLGTYTVERSPFYAAGLHPSIRRFGLQRLALPASPWLQQPRIADSLASRLVADLHLPVPVLSSVEIVGDPRLQLGDRIRITDPDGLALDGHYWIVGIRDTFSRSGYRQQITARRAATLLAWDTGVWDTNTWG